MIDIKENYIMYQFILRENHSDIYDIYKDNINHTLIIFIYTYYFMLFNYTSLL